MLFQITNTIFIQKLATFGVIQYSVKWHR